MIVQRIAGKFMGSLRLNSDRCRTLQPEDAVTIPDELASKTSADDHYLVKCLLTVPESILVTTDKDLCEAVATAALTCMSREQFLATYL